MADNNQIVPAADFQALPLAFLISAPLKAAVEAQAIASLTTKTFIETCLTGADPAPPAGAGAAGAGGAGGNAPAVREAITVDFTVKTLDPVLPGAPAGTQPVERRTTISVPLLSLVQIPNLLVNEVSVKFNYTITQTFRDQKETDRGIDFKAGTGGLLSPWVSASVSGHASSKATSEASTNRSGTLEVFVKANQAAELPPGLDRVLSMLSNSIVAKPAAPAPAAGN